ncbi:hypothetical protein AOLI_G00022500 [Acnodon oligacanthus]
MRAAAAVNRGQLPRHSFLHPLGPAHTHFLQREREQIRTSSQTEKKQQLQLRARKPQRYITSQATQHITSDINNSMKPRRLLLSIAPLPTITETHEDSSQVGCQSSPSQSLEDYVNSIKELAQPACGPVRVARTLRPRMFAKPLGKHSATSSPRCSSRTPRTHTASLVLDEFTQHFSIQKDLCSRDPVDWLFAQTQDELHRTDGAPAALRLI